VEGRDEEVTTVTERARERVDTQEITRQARRVRPGPTALLAAGNLLWAIGWCGAKVFGGIWLVLAWCAVAMRTGWREAKGKQILPDVSQVLAENQALRNELTRSGGANIIGENTAMRNEIEKLRAEIGRLRSNGVVSPG
jgi:hypothetical protein